MIDAAEIPVGTRLDADVCIVGSGPAALATATRLLPSGVSMILLEAGYPRYDRAAQSVYRGRCHGDPMQPLHRSRDRRFGGTAVRWAGRTRPFDPEDFEPRAEIDAPGWPISRRELDRYYREAADFCRIPAVSDREWSARLPREARVETPDLRVRPLGCSAPLDFGDAYRRVLDDAPSVRMLVGASVVALRAGRDGDHVERVEVARADAGRFTVRGAVVVIACGGIENARLLLASNDVVAGGLGGHGGRLGRYFMDHPTVNAALFVPGRRDFPVELFRFRGPGTDRQVHGQICLSRTAMRREGLPGAAASFTDAAPPHARAAAYGTPAVRAAREMFDDLRHREWPADAGRQTRRVIGGAPQVAATLGRRLLVRRRAQIGLRVFLEQLPDPDNRITLTRNRDRFGVPRVELRWRVGEAERRALDRLCRLLEEHFAARQLGRFEFLDPVQRGGWPATRSSACHHMGTTRMSTEPARGVVDANGRVHGIGNLYVAGSSVFPTGGCANPTLTIVALALRLGDEIARRLRGSAILDTI